MSEEAPKAPEKKTLEQFLASVPEPPSSGDVVREEAPVAEDPKAAVSSPSAETGTPPASAAAATSDPVAAIRQALKSGDLDALAEALEEDPALFSEKSTKWAAARRRERRLKDERDAALTKADSVWAKVEPVYGLAEAVAKGEFSKLPEYIQAVTGVDYDQLVLKVARARHGSDPQVEVLKRRIAELEPKAEERQAAASTAAERALHETLRDEVPAKHQVRELGAGWEAKVAAVLKESVDEDLGEPTLSPRQAADRVLRREREEFEAKAKVFGGAVAEKPARGRAPERAAGAAPANKRKLTREEWLKAQG